MLKRIIERRRRPTSAGSLKDDPDARETLAMLGVITPLIGMLNSDDLDLRIAALYALLNRGTGKSCLVNALAVESFSLNILHVLPPTRLAVDYFPERVPMTIINTSASPESKEKLIAEVKAVDVIVVTYDCGRPATNARLRTYWIPELRRLNVIVPLIVVAVSWICVMRMGTCS